MLPYVFQSLQEFPGELARSLGEDATLSDVLQTMDEHYGVVMMIDAISEELCSLKQGSGENIAKFGLCLSQQVQILHRVSQKDPTGACRGDEVRSLLQGPEP